MRISNREYIWIIKDVIYSCYGYNACSGIYETTTTA